MPSIPFDDQIVRANLDDRIVHRTGHAANLTTFSIRRATTS